MEIVERRRSNDSSLKGEGRFRAIFARASVGVALVDRNGYAIESNPALQRMLGYTPDELRGMTFYEFTHPEDIEPDATLFRDMLAGRSQQYRIEKRYLRKDGEVMWGRFSVSLLREKEDGHAFGVAILEDITERKEMDEALRQSEFKFRALFESNVVPLAFWHADGRILDANDAYLRLTGFSRAELEAGQVHWERLTAPEYSHLDRRALEDLAMGKQNIAPYEKEHVLRDGRRIPVMISISLLPGYRDRGVSLLIDLTEQKQSRERLEESKALIKAERAFLRRVIDVDPNFIFAKDRAGRFTLVNQAVADVYGTSVENLIGKTDADFNPNLEEVDAFRRMDLEVMDTLQERFIPEERITDSQGKVRWLQTVKRPLIGKDGVVNQVLGSATDITERRQAELEMARQRTELAHIGRVSMIGELTASLAHELNQPLTAILSNAQTLQRLLKEPAPDLTEVREILGDVVSDDLRAGEIIRGLRSLLKKGASDFQMLDLNGVILEVIGLIRSDALIKHVTVALRLAPEIPRVRADRIQLQQVLLNLTINALDAMKDAPVNERLLDISTMQIDAGSVQVAVQDAGTGIASDQHDKLFEPFFTNKPQGMGMGLAICRSIVHIHGGRIWATSNAGRGATFQFILPIDEDSIS